MLEPCDFLASPWLPFLLNYMPLRFTPILPSHTPHRVRADRIKSAPPPRPDVPMADPVPGRRASARGQPALPGIQVLLKQSKIMTLRFLDFIIIGDPEGKTKKKEFWSMFQKMNGGEYSLGAINEVSF